MNGDWATLFSKGMPRDEFLVRWQEYMESPEWRERATAAKERAGHRCQVCNRHASEVVLNAHHRTYERRGKEEAGDITVLCSDCHTLYERNKSLISPLPKTLSYFAQPVEHRPVDESPVVLPKQTKRRSWMLSRTPLLMAITGILGSLLLMSFVPTLFGRSGDTMAGKSVFQQVDAMDEDGCLHAHCVRTLKRATVRSRPSTNGLTLRQIDSGVPIVLTGYHQYPDSGTKWGKLADGGWIIADDLTQLSAGLPLLSVPTSRLDGEQVATVRTTIAATKTPSGENRVVAGSGDIMGQSNPTQPTVMATHTIVPTSSPTRTPVPGCPGGCTVRPKTCGQPIKGNISYSTREKIYHVPGQAYYDETNISPKYGERWFCTESEAIAAGWRKAKR